MYIVMKTFKTYIENKPTCEAAGENHDQWLAKMQAKQAEEFRVALGQIRDLLAEWKPRAVLKKH